MNSKQWAAFLGLSIAWGTSFVWIKIAVQEIGPITLVAIRLLLGSAVLLLVAALQKPAWPKSRQEWTVLTVIGITNTAIPFSLVSWGQQHIDSAVASILSGYRFQVDHGYCEPLWTKTVISGQETKKPNAYYLILCRYPGKVSRHQQE